MVAPHLIERKDSRIYEDRRREENEAFAEAIKICDAETFKEITSILEAAGFAADFVVESMRMTLDDKDHWYGVKFEKALPWLIKRLESL